MFSFLSQAALQRLQTFIKGKMIEIHVAGKFAANMCRSAVKVNESGEKQVKVVLSNRIKMPFKITYLFSICWAVDGYEHP